MNDDTRTAAPVDSRSTLLAELLDRLTARVQAGEALDPTALSAEHPAFAADIRRLVPALGLLGELSRSRAPLGTEPPAAVDGTLGDYRIGRELGRGGMGVVYEAAQISLRRRVALKVLPFAAVMDPRQVQRFKNEAVAAASLDHPHVVKVYGVGYERGVHFIAMQLIDGRSLAEFIRERRDGTTAPAAGALDPTRTLAPDATSDEAKALARAGSRSRTPVDAPYARRVAGWGVQAAGALEHAHALGVVHRDVKPGNLLVDGRGDVHVADFGLAKSALDPGLTGTGDLLGTVRYMSPEQASSKHDLVDHRSDVYSLGVTLYELLTLTPVFDGGDRPAVLSRVLSEDPTSPRVLDRNIPRDLETVVLKAMAKEPARRYQSAGELAADLQRFLGREPIRARRPGALDRAAKWARRHRAAVWSGAALLAVSTAVSAGAALVVWEQNREKEQALSDKTVALDHLERALGEKDAALGRADGALRQEVRHRARAREAADTMYTDVAERLLPREPGLTGLRREFLLKALKFYEEEAGEDATDGGTRLRVAWACKRAGRIHWANGDSPKALPLYDRAVALADRLVAEDDSPDRRAARALFYFERSWIYASLLRPKEARADRTEALSAYARLARDHPRVTEYRVDEAHVMMTLGLLVDDPIEAERQLHRGLDAAERLGRDFPGIAADKQIAHASLHLGEFLIRHAGRAEEAERHLTRALPLWRAQSEPANFNPEALFHLGKVLTDLGVVAAGRLPPDTVTVAGFFEEARAVFIRLDTVSAGHTFSGLNELVRGLMACRREDTALDCLREAVRLRTADDFTYTTLGNLLQSRKEFAEATSHYREAIRRWPDNLQLQNDLANTIRSQENDLGSAKAHRAGIQPKPKFAEAYLSFGNALERNNRLPDAETAFREAVRLDPRSREASDRLDLFLDTTGRPKEAEARYREAIRLRPNSVGDHYDLASALRQRGNMAEAVICYQQVVRLEPDHLLAHFDLGSLLVHMGKQAEATASLREVLRQRPNHSGTHRLLADSYLILQKPAEAEASFREVIRLRSADAGVYSNLGIALKMLGRFDESLAMHRRAQELVIKRNGSPSEYEQRVKVAERYVSTAAKLPNVAAGEGKPADLDEWLVLAEVAHLRKWYATSAKLHAEFLLVDSPRVRQSTLPRYNAARAAVMAGCGHCEDPVKPGDEDRRSFRGKALGWLTAELLGYSKLVPIALPDITLFAPHVRDAMRNWRADPALSPVRDETELKKLPESEQAEWRKLWTDVAKLQERLAPPPGSK